MELDFWLQRWSQHQIGFHLDQVNPNLIKHWHEVGHQPNDIVFVPLCGKSADLVWLAQQRCRVIGIECSPLAIKSFFNENKLAYHTHSFDQFNLHQSGQISLIEGDIFKLVNNSLEKISIVYDRAALVALPEHMRKPYVDKLSELTSTGARILLVSLEYDQHKMAGPPFSVPSNEITKLYASAFDINKLSSQDILNSEQRFKQRGLDSLIESVYLLVRT